MECQIINQEKIIFDGRAKSLLLPGKSGQLQILPFHCEIFSLLKEGEIVIETESDKKKIFFCKSGLLFFYNNRANIFVLE